MLHGVGFFVGQGLHPDDGLAFVERLCTRQSTRRLAAGRDFDLSASLIARAAAVRLPSSSSDDLHLLLGLQVVVHVGREHDFVLLDEEPRGLQADDEVLAGDDFGLAFADLGAVAHAPDLDLPGGEVLGHVERRLRPRRRRRSSSAPTQRAVSAKFGADRGLDHAAGGAAWLWPLSHACLIRDASLPPLSHAGEPRRRRRMRAPPRCQPSRRLPNLVPSASLRHASAVTAPSCPLAVIGHRPAEDAQILHPDLFGRARFANHAAEARSPSAGCGCAATSRRTP